MAQPTVFTLSGEYITTESSLPQYYISQNIPSITHKTTFIQFSRIAVDKEDPEAPFLPHHTTVPTVDGQPPIPTTKLYNLVHPYNAHHRTDIPAAFYMTNNSAFTTTLGNVKLVSSTSPKSKKRYLPFYKPTFTAMLNPSSNSSSKPLFIDDESSHQPLFIAKPSRGGRVWEWFDAKGENLIAREEGPDPDSQGFPMLPGEPKINSPGPKLIILAPDEMVEEMQDALVAVWVLRLWWAVAEEKRFDDEGTCCD